MRISKSWGVSFLLGGIVLGGPVLPADPEAAPDAKRIRTLVKELDAKRYPVRQKADRQLRQLGEAVVPLLRKELDATRSAEVHRRLEKIIRDLSISERLLALIEDLDSSYFIIRERADREIRAYGKAALPLVKKELKKATDLGVRARLKQIIADLAKTK
jgi:hypothetical protein